MIEDIYHESHDGLTPSAYDDGTDQLSAEAREERERIRVNLGLAQAAPPRLIDDRYEVLRRHGHGGMGVVYHARDTRLDRDVALKLVRSQPFTDEVRLRERLVREAKALAKLDGRDHVVAVHDVGRHQDRIYFTMLYVDGPNLRQWQDHHYRSVDSIVDVYLQAARGLATAHRLGIIHRDFKPGNVLVRAEDQRVMVADFGIAEAVGTSDTSIDGVETTLGDSPLTATGAVLGTLSYLAPERIPRPDRPALRATLASDQFSFCVALWEALAGKVPFAGRTATEMVAAFERGPVGVGRIPHWLRPVLRRGLAHDPDARFASMDALIRAIESRRARGRLVAVGGVSLALFLGLSAIAILHSDSPILDGRVPHSTFADSAAAVWSGDPRRPLARGREHGPETIDHVVEELELWCLTESARAAVILGSDEQALALCDQAIDMANQLEQGQHAAELAEAHAARAEVSTHERRSGEALPEFEAADVHAHVVGHSEREISSRALWAKARVLAGSLDRLGATHQKLERWDDALTAYQQAAQVLAEAGVPSGHSVAIDVQRSLENLQVELERREGFDRREGVVRR